jgi:cytochrome c oxidase assembly protein subunit 15
MNVMAENTLGGKATPASGAMVVTVLGFAMAVGMWVGAFVTHMPAFDLPPRTAGPVVLGVWLVAAVLLGRFLTGTAPAAAAARGALAGLLSAALGLLILGALIAQPPTGPDGLPAPGFSGLRPSGAMTALGFLGAGIIIGAAGITLGSRLGSTPGVGTAGAWRFRMTLVCIASIVPLLVTGGAVTSTNSGLAIRGWPDSYGANMFLYPIALMSHPGMFLEHTHRLFGTLCGLTTLATSILLFRGERGPDGRWWVRAWAIAMFVMVCVQGLLGGIRVRFGLEVGTREGQLFALFHGVFAQVFLASVVAAAAFVSPTFMTLRRGPSSDGMRRFKMMATGALHAMWLQLILGGVYRHFRADHALWSHAGFAVLVAVLVAGAAFSARATAANLTGNLTPARPVLRRLGVGMLVVVALQFTLGWIAFAAVKSSPVPKSAPPTPEQLATAHVVPWWEALITTAHQANGALVLALAVLGFVWARRIWGLALESEQRHPTESSAAPLPS